MKKIVLSAAALSMLMGAVAQAEISEGRIANIEPGGHALTLQSGETFTLDQSQDKTTITGFRAGDTVTVNWSEKGGQKVATSVSGFDAGRIMGTITDKDPNTGKVTLDNGHTYVIRGADARTVLEGFRVGDQVEILGADQDGGSGVLRASSITSTGTNDVVGMVKSIDPGQGDLILENGMKFSVREDSEHRSILSGLRPGDKVHVSWAGADSAKTAISISPVDR